MPVIPSNKRAARDMYDLMVTGAEMSTRQSSREMASEVVQMVLVVRYCKDESVVRQWEPAGQRLIRN
jgi:hypothetical protein